MSHPPVGASKRHPAHPPPALAAAPAPAPAPPLSSSSSSSSSSSLSPRLFATSVLEPRDADEERHDRCFALVHSLTADKGEKEANDALAAAVSKSDPKAHEDICVGLVVGALGEPEQAPRHYRDLAHVARDGMAAACQHLTMLVLEKYPKMFPSSKQQLLWLTREMIKSSVVGMENICWNLMRQIAGGDVSRPNLWLADHLLDIFVDHRAWLERFPFLLASVVYTYLRVIEDHFLVPALREKEVRFVVSLMRDRFADVTVIGRDLLRVLQNVARIPEFERLWADVVNDPKSLHPTFAGVTQLMHTRTSRRFLQSRITPEMEKKLVFLTSQVRFGTHKRYQDWFQRQYLSTNESQSLRCDLIRFIVGVIHPTNELLGSDIIPRWAVIGWLLTTCTNQVASSNAKLALFYDWLFFNPEKDNIMNIEPAILVMHHSMRPHPAITATLLDFLCRIIGNFFPSERDKVHQGIISSLKTILDKRVLPSLQPLFDNQRLDEELRAMLRERFTLFVTGREAEHHHQQQQHQQQQQQPQQHPPILDKEDENEAAFSDDDDEEKPLLSASHKAGKRSGRQQQQQSRQRQKKENETSEELGEEVKEALRELRAEKGVERCCEIVDSLVKAAIAEEYGFEQCSAMAQQLAEALAGEFEGRMFPGDGDGEDDAAAPDPEAVEDSVGRPIFVVFRSLCEMSDSDPNRGVILQLLAELYALQPRVGYYLLYFLSADKTVSRVPREKAAVYRDLCEAIDDKFSLDICLVNDMRQCQEDDVALFVHLIPEIFANFPKPSVGNTDLLYLIVSCVDGRQVQTLAWHILSRDFVMFKKDSFGAVVNSSLGWETFEQYALWQLASAHDLPVDCIVPLVPKLDAIRHAEALTSVLLLLKRERPTAELLKMLLSREAAHNDRFVCSVLIHWTQEYEEKLGDLVSSHLGKQLASSGGGGGGTGIGGSGGGGGGGGSTKRKRGGGGSSGGTVSHSVELTLKHLDELRQNCKQYDFFNLRSLQQSLQQVRHACTEAQKRRFMDLFALADSDSETEDSTMHQSRKKNRGNQPAPGGSAGRSPGKSKAASSRNSKPVNDSSSEESSEDSEESEKPAYSSRSSTKALSSRGSGSRGAGGKNPRKRANKVSSYKISSDESSDEGEVVKRAPKKKKKVSHSDSD